MCRLGGTAARASSSCRSSDAFGAAVAASSKGVAPARVEDTLGEALLEARSCFFEVPKKNMLLILGAKRKRDSRFKNDHTWRLAYLYNSQKTWGNISVYEKSTHLQPIEITTPSIETQKKWSLETWWLSHLPCRSFTPSPWLLKALAQRPNALLWLRRRGLYILSHPGSFKTENQNERNKTSPWKKQRISFWVSNHGTQTANTFCIPLPNVKFKHPLNIQLRLTTHPATLHPAPPVRPNMYCHMLNRADDTWALWNCFSCRKWINHDRSWSIYVDSKLLSQWSG